MSSIRMIRWTVRMPRAFRGASNDSDGGELIPHLDVGRDKYSSYEGFRSVPH